MPIKTRPSATKTKTAKKTTTHPTHKKAKKTSSSTKQTSPSTDKFASNALKFIDQAAELLRDGITTSTSQSVHMRTAAKKRAQALLVKAHNSLGDALEAGTSALHKMLNKI